MRISDWSSDVCSSDLQIDHIASVTGASGAIESSLYEAARAEGVPMAILMDNYRVLGHAVDFQRDIQPGDRFSLGYEILEDGDLGTQHPGSLVYAPLTLGERRAEERRVGRERVRSCRSRWAM